eukprot:COSAG04_NODE_22901_length_347_cov_0.879032_1_plen_63_part_10
MNAFVEASPANVAIIQEQLKVTYIQASLRYLNKMDKDVANDGANDGTASSKNQGEGWAFYKVI